MTLRAFINRDGQFKENDINGVVLKAWYNSSVLEEAVLKHTREIKKILQDYAKMMSEHISKTHQRIIGTLQSSYSAKVLKGLNSSIADISKAALKMKADDDVKNFIKRHPSALRKAIQSDLNHVYSECRRDRGPGVMGRILGRLANEVSDTARFKKCQEKLANLLETMKDESLERVDIITLRTIKKLELEYESPTKQNTSIQSNDIEKAKVCVKDCLLAIVTELCRGLRNADRSSAVTLVQDQIGAMGGG